MPSGQRNDARSPLARFFIFTCGRGARVRDAYLSAASASRRAAMLEMNAA
jgi:hypothetical protein